MHLKAVRRLSISEKDAMASTSDSDGILPSIMKTLIFQGLPPKTRLFPAIPRLQAAGVDAVGYGLATSAFTSAGRIVLA